MHSLAASGVVLNPNRIPNFIDAGTKILDVSLLLFLRQLDLYNVVCFSSSNTIRDAISLCLSTDFAAKRFGVDRYSNIGNFLDKKIGIKRWKTECRDRIVLVLGLATTFRGVPGD